jgi:hypothetical protein
LVMRFNASRFNKQSWQFWLVGILLSIVVWWVVSLGWLGWRAVVHGQDLQRQVKAHDWVEARHSWVQLTGHASLIHTLTARLIPDVRIVVAADTCGQDVLSLLAEPPVSAREADLHVLSDVLRACQPALRELEHSWSKTWVLQRRVPQLSHLPLAQAQGLLTEVQLVLSTLQTGNHHFFLFLQNTDELRPTGGFMGSVIELTIQDGRAAWQLHDVYDIDGQFLGSVPAPAGVHEYLSSGKGWHLPDANWSLDFPTSADQIRFFLEQSGFGPVDGVGVVNMSVGRDALEVLGPVRLNDYQVTVTAENLGETLRSRRQEFFPGSRQKVHLLQQFVEQTSLLLAQASPQQWQELVNRARRYPGQKSLQFTFRQPELQSLVDRYRVAGRFNEQHAPHFLALIEANVGINKVNDSVQRGVTLTRLSPTQTSVEITYALKDPSQGYVNYLRAWVPLPWQISGVHASLPADSVPTAGTAQLSDARLVQEVGWVMSILPASTGVTSFVITHPAEASVLPWWIEAQSGVGPVPYRLQSLDGRIQDVLLDVSQEYTW